mgnify:CR=1 FL=1
MSKKRNHNRTSISTLRIRAAYVGVPSEGVNRKDLARDLANWAMANNAESPRNRNFSSALTASGKFPAWKEHCKRLAAERVVMLLEASKKTAKAAIVSAEERKARRAACMERNTKHQAERRKHALANPNSRAFKKAERAAAAELKYQSSKKAA